MFENILLSPGTKKSVQFFLSRPAGALMLTGPEGSGKYYLGKAISCALLGLKDQEGLQHRPYFLEIIKPDDRQDITIDQIRSINKFLKLRSTGSATLRRVVLIVDADKMNAEAQNALLKILEEPPDDSQFILSVSSSFNVLPTIASRTQIIDVKPVDFDTSVAFFSKDFPKNKLDNAWRLSQGRAGLMAALLNSKQVHPLKAAVEKSKEILALPSYSRLVEFRNISKNRDNFLVFLDGLSLVLEALHHAAINKGTSTNLKMLKNRQLVIDLKQRLQANSSLKLVTPQLGLLLNI